MEFSDAILLLHPVIAIVVVFPLIGIVVNRAFQTRQRRLQTKSGEKSKIPPVVGQEHVQLGRWLTVSVVGIVLIALGNDVFGRGVTGHGHGQGQGHVRKGQVGVSQGRSWVTSGRAGTPAREARSRVDRPATALASSRTRAKVKPRAMP